MNHFFNTLLTPKGLEDFFKKDIKIQKIIGDDLSKWTGILEAEGAEITTIFNEPYNPEADKVQGLNGEKIYVHYFQNSNGRNSFYSLDSNNKIYTIDSSIFIPHTEDTAIKIKSIVSKYMEERKINEQCTEFYIRIDTDIIFYISFFDDTDTTHINFKFSQFPYPYCNFKKEAVESITTHIEIDFEAQTEATETEQTTEAERLKDIIRKRTE